MSFFTDNYSKLSFPVGSAGFRPAQLAAIQAVSAYFFNQSAPAIVVMPTGSGKTTVAATLAFTLRARRLLVLTPSRLLREQIAEKFRSLSDLEKIGALDVLAPRPAVKVISNRVKLAKEWDDCRNYDVVVATVSSVSAMKEAIPRIPEDLFDVVIVDEAHHAPAATWARVLAELKLSKQILLTATPFRRDAKEIRGKIVFTYDIRRAHDDGVFGDLTFIPAWPESGETADEAIARVAVAKFRQDQSNGLKHLLMVRVDSIKRGRQLESLYEGTGLNLRFVSGASALSTVKRTVRELESSELDGIICVNMFGEGFDLPRLKIAALHSPHRSLAVTLQFIGRFARTTDPEIGEASFVAFPEEQDNELQELWTSGAPWPDFIHNLSASRIEREESTREALASFDVSTTPELTDLSLTSLQPYFHAKIFRCPSGVDLTAEVEQPFNESVVFKATSDSTGAVATITQILTKPRWTTDQRIMNVGYELDILHFNDAEQLLFICSTRKTPEHYRRQVNNVSKGNIYELSAALINRALNDIEGIQFFSVGMRKRQFGGRGESYRTLAGPSADLAVNEQDGHYYDRGHSFGKGRTDGKEVTLGISSASKIWSNTVKLIPDFVDWCDGLSSKIGSGISKPTGSGIDNLSAGEPLETIPERVLFGVFDKKTYTEPPLVFSEGEERGSLADYDLLVVQSDDRSIDFRLSSPQLTWDGKFSLDTFPLITPGGDGEDEPSVGGKHNAVLISDYLNEFPPTFYLETLGAIEGASLFPPASGAARLDSSDFEKVDWAKERVNIELEKPAQGLATTTRSIFAWLEARLKSSAADFIYNDDGAGEIADFITAQDVDGSPSISLYHCKASSRDEAGSRVADLYDVCGQVIRCGVWIAGRRLVDQIEHRLRVRGTGGLIRGDLETLKRAFTPERRQRVRFKVVIVQPGVSVGKLRDSPHQLLLAAKSYALNANFNEFTVIASK